MHTQGVCEGACMCVCVTAQGKPRFGFQLKEFKHNWKTDIRCSKTYDSALSRWALCFCGLSKSLICKEAREGQQGERTGTNGSHWERQLEEMLSFHYFWMGKLEVLERICVPKCVWPHEGLVALKDPCGKTVGNIFPLSTFSLFALWDSKTYMLTYKCDFTKFPPCTFAKWERTFEGNNATGSNPRLESLLKCMKGFTLNAI